MLKLTGAWFRTMCVYTSVSSKADYIPCGQTRPLRARPLKNHEYIPVMGITTSCVSNRSSCTYSSRTRGYVGVVVIVLMSSIG